MGRFLILLGIVLIIGSIIFMGLVFGMAGEDVSAQIISPFACEDNETLTQYSRTVSDFDGTSQTIDFFCEDSEGQERNVTITAIMVIIVGFVGLLLTGIFATIAGAGIASKNAIQNFSGDIISGQYGTTVDLRATKVDLNDGTFKEYNPQIPANLRAVLKQASYQLDQLVGNETLADKLEQLHEAYQKGLITTQEYDKIRASILDSMDD